MTKTTPGIAQDDRFARQQEQRRRRAREDADVIGGKHLGVRRDILDGEKFAYRWFNDDDIRLQAKAEQQWDIVKNDGGVVSENTADLGDAIKRYVGQRKDGSPRYAYLCRKYRQFYDEDKARRTEELDAELAELKRGNAKDGSPQGDYVPHSGIRIGA